MVSLETSLTLPRNPTFEVSLGLPWEVIQGEFEVPGSARDALRMASHGPCGHIWEPRGYLAEGGRPVRHNTQVYQARSASPPPALEASVFSFPLSAHGLRRVRDTFRGGTPTSPSCTPQPRPVILEFYDHAGPVAVLAGDYMSPPADGQPRPGTGMPEVVASAAFSRRGYNSRFPSSADRAGDIYTSFHVPDPPPIPATGWHENARCEVP